MREALAVELGIKLEHPDAPVDALLDVGIPAGVVLQPERWFVAQEIKEEEQGVRVTGQSDLRGGAMCEARPRNPLQQHVRVAGDDCAGGFRTHASRFRSDFFAFGMVSFFFHPNKPTELYQHGIV